MGTATRDVVLVHEIFDSGPSLPTAQTNHFNSETWVLPRGYHAAMLVPHGRSGLFTRLLWCTPRDQVIASSSSLNPVGISEEPETRRPHISPSSSRCRYVHCDISQPEQHYSMSPVRFREWKKGGQRPSMSVILVHFRNLLVWQPVFYKSSVLSVFVLFLINASFVCLFVFCFWHQGRVKISDVFW